jgi:hypothetical protein
MILRVDFDSGDLVGGEWQPHKRVIAAATTSDIRSLPCAPLLVNAQE